MSLEERKQNDLKSHVRLNSPNQGRRVYSK